jgi:hypothetical protein
MTGVEEWKPITGYEGYFDVSSFGRIRSWIQRKGNKTAKADIPRLRILQKTTHGYWAVSLKVGGNRKVFAVHRLVLEAFLQTTHDRRRSIASRQ